MTDETQAFDGTFDLGRAQRAELEAYSKRSRSPVFVVLKRVFDILSAVLALPVVVLMAGVLLLINPIWNPGPLIFAQTRMGRRCRPFQAYKFRTMRQVAKVDRGPDDPLETDRITPLGRFLRRTRIDEFPQFLNVLMGQMSLVGPRPDCWEHAVHYAEHIPGYRRRYVMRPGITGLAQVDNGYAEGTDATTVKTRHDLRYIAQAGFALDWYILRRTVRVMLTGFGAR